MSCNTNIKGDIRKALIEADLAECMLARPCQPFASTQIPACIGFLTRSKAERARKGISRQRHTGYAEEAGFCNAVKLDDIRMAEDVLTPGRNAEAAAQEVGAQPLEEQVARLAAALGEQFTGSARLGAESGKRLAGLGYGS